MVQRGDFTVAIACVPCGPRRSLIYAWAWGFCVCWKLSAAEKVKPDCCYSPAVVSTLLTPLPVSCPLTTPLHYNGNHHFLLFLFWYSWFFSGSIVLKCLERLVPRKLHDDIKNVLDLFQFAYKDKLGTGYAINTLVHLILKHLKQPNAYACMPFVDFSSAFNTIQPHVLLEKKKRKSTLSSLNGTILFWLADHNWFESTKPIPSPSLQTQGCVSSPLLYTNFTHWPVPFFFT